MSSERQLFLPIANEDTVPGPQLGAGDLFLRTLWFGLLAGWLELGLVLATWAVNPHVSMDRLRTNQHFVWMIPVADALLFGVVALAIALLARFRAGPARWVAPRLATGLCFLTLLLTIEGMYVIASVVLSCGLASRIGPWLGSRGAAFSRLVRVSFPAMAVGLVALTGLVHKSVESAERRALALRPPAKPGAPNVLLIVLDTVRAESLSLHGYDRPTAPNLQRLASKGLVFAEARSTAPWTLPSHASMMTGRWPHELSVGPDLPLDGTFPTLAEVLGREGYATGGFVGNTTYCNTLYGMGRGFARYGDVYENEAVSLFEIVRSSGLGRRVLQVLGYPVSFEVGDSVVRKTAEMVNRDLLAWLTERPAGEPYFAFVNYFDAHTPYLFHEGPDPRFGMAALPLPEHVEIDKRFRALAWKPAAEFTPEQIKMIGDGYTLFQDSYDSCIAYVDRQIGLLLDEMGRRGLLENTLVIVTSDHGEQFGERGIHGHAASLYRREVHIPLLVIPPAGLPSPRIVDEPVSNREIAATVADLVNMGPQNPFPGRSLTRFLDDRARPSPEPSPVLCEVQQIETLPPTEHVPATVGPLVSLTSRDRVYIRNHRGREELYDLLHDPFDSVDLSREPESRPVIDRFREELTRLGCGTGAPTR
jgi:arylsulfatase A-like enzyme